MVLAWRDDVGAYVLYAHPRSVADGVDGQGRTFPRRIDHVFVSPGTTVVDAQYITDPESDHPALVVEIVP